MSEIATNIAQINIRIAQACIRAGRPTTAIQLMAVSKMQPASAIVEAANHGITFFGENRVQESATKKDHIPANCRVAMIGHLQSNKGRRAAALFDEVHSLDSLVLAERLNAAAQSLNKRLSVLLEIKLSEEAAKTGLLPNSPELTALLERLPNLASLEAKGLMTVPPWDEDAEAVRPYFVRLRQLRDQLAQQHPRLSLAELSMGMSNDFEVGIEEGATIVRIGTAIFGKRTQR